MLCPCRDEYIFQLLPTSINKKRLPILKNVIQFSVVRSRGNYIMPKDLPSELTQGIDINSLIEETPIIKPSSSDRGKLDIQSVKEAIKKTGGNKSKAARVLGVGRATLYRFLTQNKEIKDYVDQF
jgi:DNA-binding NtrC family response regulator